MQNIMRIDEAGLFIHALELKLWHFEVFPYVCTGKLYAGQKCE